MVRDFNIEDIDEVNLLLKYFNYQLDKNSFDNVFLNVVVYGSYGIKGVLVYQNLIDKLSIDYIIVDERFREQGIATELLKYLENKYDNIENMTLEVRKSNIAAIRFYKKNGFKEAAIRKNYYGSEDGVLMLKEYR